MLGKANHKNDAAGKKGHNNTEGSSLDCQRTEIYFTVGDRIFETLVFVNFSRGCINFKNLRAHQQEEVLRIPKHSQHVKFGLFVAKLWQFIENNSFPK